MSARSFVPTLGAACALALASPAGAKEAPTYGPRLEGFAYPYPLANYAFVSQGESLEMAYMDVAPTGPANGRTVVLLHGKNFCGATWEASIAFLAARGYRVVVPDQVGWCASTKPTHYQYSFQQLAANTAALLDTLGVARATFVGHSTGGMLAIRFALMDPGRVERLVLVDPIGLEDWKALGVPSRSVDAWFAHELDQSADKIRAYERSTYYVGTWKPEYERWVGMLAGLNAGSGHRIVAWNSALIYDMIFTQPVVYEFGLLTMPVVLMIGTEDTTAIGSDGAPPEVRSRLGHYPDARAQRGRANAARPPDRIRGPRSRAADPGPGALPSRARGRAGRLSRGVGQADDAAPGPARRSIAAMPLVRRVVCAMPAAKVSRRDPTIDSASRARVMPV